MSAGVWWIAALGGAAAGLAVPGAHAAQRFHAEALGTSLVMTAVGGDQLVRQAAAAAALSEIARLDAVLSGWRGDSELARLNASSGGAVSPDLFAAVAAAERWRVHSGGAFDGRLGRVETLWREAALTNTAPDSAALLNAARQARAAPVTLDPAAMTVDRGGGAVFALDGIAKGYVIDAALRAAREAGPELKGVMIDIGGDLAAWGEGPAGGAWTIGAHDPDRPEDNAAPAMLIRLRGGAVATSGPGPRDLEIGGQRHDLRLSANTGETLARVRSVTAVAGCAMEADALATALSVITPRDGLKLVEATPHAEAFITGADGARHYSSGWMRLADAPPPRLIRTQAPAAAAAPWPAGFTLTIDYSMPKPDQAPIYSPYVSIWVTDTLGKLVRQIVLQGDDPNFIDQNNIWWRRVGRALPRVQSISRPTRPAGRYTAVWDGKNQAGEAVGQGRYTLHIEAIREHGLHSYQSMSLDLGAAPLETRAEAGDELGVSRARYGKR